MNKSEWSYSCSARGDISSTEWHWSLSGRPGTRIAADTQRALRIVSKIPAVSADILHNPGYLHGGPALCDESEIRQAKAGSAGQGAKGVCQGYGRAAVWPAGQAWHSGTCDRGISFQSTDCYELHWNDLHRDKQSVPGFLFLLPREGNAHSMPSSPRVRNCPQLLSHCTYSTTAPGLFTEFGQEGCGYSGALYRQLSNRGSCELFCAEQLELPGWNVGFYVSKNYLISYLFVFLRI